MDRRNMLIGLGGVYGAAMTLGGDPMNALAAPIIPDFTACTGTLAEWDGAGSVGDDCCPPKMDPTKILEFDFKNYQNPVTKVRRPAHLAMKDPEWLNDYKRAIRLMKSLPTTDPRSFIQQANVHCAYCDGAYPVVGHPEDRYLVHGNWLFASFHRWELFFFERIMAKLINKPGFALPYWNFDHPDGMRVPEMFKDIDSPLFNPNRNQNHQDRIVDLSFNGIEHSYSDDEQIKQNLLLMRKQMLYPTKSSVFFGKPYRAGDPPNPDLGPGTLELSPHNNVHTWMGSDTMRSNQDMGSFWSSARDPAFYTLHSNVDRLWHIWRNELPGRRVDIKDPDYLDASFVFYDENAYAVRVYVRDSFDIDKLGYTYETQELPWFARPTGPKPSTPEKIKITDEVVTFPKKLDEVIKTKVVRPKKSRSKDEKEEQEEVLVISFVPGHPVAGQFTKFDVYVNDDNDYKPNDKTIITPQYAGSFSRLPHRGSRHGNQGVTLRLALNKLLEEIGAQDEEALQITIVPKSGSENVVVNDVKIEFVS